MAPPKIPMETRLWSRVTKGDGCWEWTGGYGSHGYGMLSGILAHRLAWELTNGPIPQGHYICHSCDNRKCVRPDHLFVGTPQDNARDMVAKGRDNPHKRHVTHCAQGHAYTDENTRIDRRGWRRCVECWRQWGRETDARRAGRRHRRAA